MEKKLSNTYCHDMKAHEYNSPKTQTYIKVHIVVFFFAQIMSSVPN